MKATIEPNEIAVEYAERPDVGRDFLAVDVPNGWDDVKKLTKKVLTFRGRKFTFCAWNSDTLKANFVAPHGGSANIATVK